jgi:hypothetical protein
MFTNYKSRILEEYKLKRDRNTVSMNLIHATPAKIKAECLTVLETRFSKKDERMLTSFFGRLNGEGEYRNAIKKSDADKFKPLTNFLRGNTKATDENNIELLAWLIDYEPRPYQINPGGDTENQNIEPGGDFRKPVVVGKPRNSKKWNWTQTRQVSTFCIVLAALTFLYQHYTKVELNPLHPPFNGDEQCMYWAGDHYKPVLCNLKFEHTPVYALDADKVQHLKRITKPDTITKKSIGRLWYAKVNGNIEFYTSPGYHPVYTNKMLKPLTLYMYTKYILYRKKRNN